MGFRLTLRSPQSHTTSLPRRNMAALQALDRVRQALLARGCASDADELRLAGLLACVAKPFRDHHRGRVRKLLDGVDRDSMAYDGLLGVWERGIKDSLVVFSGLKWHEQSSWDSDDSRGALEVVDADW